MRRTTLVAISPPSSHSMLTRCQLVCTAVLVMMQLYQQQQRTAAVPLFPFMVQAAALQGPTPDALASLQVRRQGTAGGCCRGLGGAARQHDIPGSESVTHTHTHDPPLARRAAAPLQARAEQEGGSKVTGVQAEAGIAAAVSSLKFAQVRGAPAHSSRPLPAPPRGEGAWAGLICRPSLEGSRRPPPPCCPPSPQVRTINFLTIMMRNFGELLEPHTRVIMQAMFHMFRCGRAWARGRAAAGQAQWRGSRDTGSCAMCPPPGPAHTHARARAQPPLSSLVLATAPAGLRPTPSPSAASC